MTLRLQVTLIAPEVLPTFDPSLEDCYFRMLQPHEIQAAMAFASDYVVLGNKREKVKQLGNAVTPPVMQMILTRCLESLSVPHF